MLEWRDGGAAVRCLNVGEDDDALVARMSAADKAGIDAPFGWPVEFAEAVAAHSRLGPWPHDADARPRLVFRATDRHAIAAGSRPLSVSTDRIGVTAMRCAWLLDRVAAAGEAVDRAGSGRLAEVYPAAALRRWGFTASGYKRAAGLDTLAELVADLERRAPWLELAPAARELCLRSDDALDALVAALVARAAARGLTEPPPERERERAAREGWIHLPVAGSFERLASG